MLLEEFLLPPGITQTKVAELLGVPFQRMNRIINKRQSVTADTALRLARLFKTSPDFWLNLQLVWDLYHAQHSKSAQQIAKIKPFPGLTRAS